MLLRMLEEIFPQYLFYKNKKSILKKVQEKFQLGKTIERYAELGLDGLDQRIKEERERGTKIDEKTFKFTLALSVSLTVLSVASGAFVNLLPSSSIYSSSISIMCGVASLYMLSAGIISLGAVKTMPTYGYGTEYLINRADVGAPYLAEALCLQEKMNVIRHLRNEAAYQSLRNGFIILFVALLLSILIIGSNRFCPRSTDEHICLLQDSKSLKQLEAEIPLSSDKQIKVKSK